MPRSNFRLGLAFTLFRESRADQQEYSVDGKFCNLRAIEGSEHQ